MRWINTLSQASSIEMVLEKSTSDSIKICADFGPPDLTFVFISTGTMDPMGESTKSIFEASGTKSLIGCSAGGVVGAGREIENHPAISITFAWLPEVGVHPFRVQNQDLPDLESSRMQWQDLLGLSGIEQPSFVVLSDPFSFRLEHFLSGMDYAFPSSVKVGGLASGGQVPGKNRLYVNSDQLSEGLVGVALSGNIILEAIVAQGCRPIGQPMIVTACQDQFIISVDGRPPLQVLEEIYENSPDLDRILIRNSLFLGIGIDHAQESFEMGDFLIRNIIGVDSKKGILAVASPIRSGQVVQFHLRDAGTSSEELHFVLDRYSKNNDTSEIAGALLFSCLGRGVYLYGAPNHDTDLFQQKAGKIPLGGFFCNGEIGPIGGTTYLHGYTSSFGIFRNRSKKVT